MSTITHSDLGIGCCHSMSVPSPRAWENVAGTLSVGMWLLIPKCPLCVAAHVAFWTGLGLTYSQAAYLRWSLMIVVGAALVGLVVKRQCSWVRERQ